MKIIKKTKSVIIFLDKIDMFPGFLPLLGCSKLGKFKSYGIIYYYLIEAFLSGRQLGIILKHKQSFRCVIKAEIPQNLNLLRQARCAVT